jgi:hypothetical protein
MHSLRAFNDRRKNSRALKAAIGPTLASKDYTPDTAGREKVNDLAEYLSNPQSGTMSRKVAHAHVAKRVG